MLEAPLFRFRSDAAPALALFAVMVAVLPERIVAAEPSCSGSPSAPKTPAHAPLKSRPADTAAAQRLSEQAARVAEFDGSVMHLGYENFFSPGIDMYENFRSLTHFFWEAWAMPGKGNTTRYLISDGYGGAHAILFGFDGEPNGPYILSGNVYVEPVKNWTKFGSDDGPAANEWGHFAVGWDGARIVTYFDGVPVGQAAWNGPRRSAGSQGGGGTLYIGGSDHQNFIGRLAQLRGFEGVQPIAHPLTAFAPPTVFENVGYGGAKSAFLYRSWEPVLKEYESFGESRNVTVSKPPPRTVLDESAPGARLSSRQQTTAAMTPAAVPRAALIFDSFSRASATYAFDGKGGLGMTEGGTAGRRAWRTSRAKNERESFGILNGAAVALGDGGDAAWIETTTPNVDIRVDRRPGLWGSGISTGLVFRRQDARNFLVAYAEGTQATGQRLNVSAVQNGTRKRLSGDVQMPEKWTTLRVVTRSKGDLEVYADATRLYSTRFLPLASARESGLWSNSADSALANRWDTFTVFRAP